MSSVLSWIFWVIWTVPINDEDAIIAGPGSTAGSVEKYLRRRPGLPDPTGSNFGMSEGPRLVAGRVRGSLCHQGEISLCEACVGEHCD